MPTALVLSGGGARAAYQAGALEALAEIAPSLTVPIITGVSAGAINALHLAAHPGTLAEATRDLRGQWARLTPDQVYAARPAMFGRALLRSIGDLVGHKSSGTVLRGVLDMHPLRGFLSAAVDVSGIPRNLAAGRLRAVALSTTSYNDGCTVTFVQGAPDIEMWARSGRYAVREHLTVDHVLASAAIPIVFPAVQLASRGFFGDGSVRQATPLAPAVHLGARKLIAIGIRAHRPEPSAAMPEAEYPSSAEVVGLLMHSLFLDSLDADAERLERVNDLLGRQASPHPALQRVELLLLRPTRNLGTMASNYPFTVPPTVRWAVRAMGGRRRRASDVLSYLLFAPPFTTDLMDLGYHDTLSRRGRVEDFLAKDIS
jgi:NTE family protein